MVVAGHVTFSDGTPVAGAKVKAHRWKYPPAGPNYCDDALDPFANSVTTASDGSYILTTFPGKHSIGVQFFPSADAIGRDRESKDTCFLYFPDFSGVPYVTDTTKDFVITAKALDVYFKDVNGKPMAGLRETTFGYAESTTGFTWEANAYSFARFKTGADGRFFMPQVMDVPGNYFPIVLDEMLAGATANIAPDDGCILSDGSLITTIAPGRSPGGDRHTS